MPLNPRTFGYPYSKTTTDSVDGSTYPVNPQTGQIVNLEPVFDQAPKKQDELTEALKEVQRRKTRNNRINDQIELDTAYNYHDYHKDAGVVDNRDLGTAVINGKKYIVDANNNITNTVTYNRPLTAEERRRADAGDMSVYNPRARVQGNTYVESQQLTNEDLAKRRWAKTIDRASTRSLDTALRAERMRNKIRYGMLTKDAEMSDNQKEVAERWRKERAFGGTHSARRQVELSAEQQQREQQQREQQIALADKAAAAKAEELASQERIAMVNAQAAKYGHDQALSIAQMNKDAQENVARINASGQVLAAGQKGSNTQDLAKRANEYISLAQKLATGGTMNEMERTIAETAIRKNDILSEEEKALKLQQLQSGNFVYLANFLLSQAQGLYEQAGVFMPISPAHGQKPATPPANSTPTTPPANSTPTTPPATPPANPTPKPAIDIGKL